MHLKSFGAAGNQLKSPFKRAQEEVFSSDSNDGSSKEGRSNEYNALIRAPMDKAHAQKIISLDQQARFSIKSKNFRRNRVDSMEEVQHNKELLKNESVLEQISERSS